MLDALGLCKSYKAVQGENRGGDRSQHLRHFHKYALSLGESHSNEFRFAEEKRYCNLQEKLAASLVLPAPLYTATCG